MAGQPDKLVLTSEGDFSHDFIVRLYRNLLAFFQAAGAPTPHEFVSSVAANVAGAAICDLPEAEQERVLKTAIDAMTLTVRSTRISRASGHEAGHG